MDKHIRKLTKLKRSYYLGIPIEIVRKYGYKEKQKFVVEDKGRGELKIKDWKKQ